MSASSLFEETFPPHVRIVEVGPRDGLQNESMPVSLSAKLALVESLADTGLQAIEAGSFVSPDWIPQMADTVELYRALKRKPGVQYPALVPNLKGLEAALACGVTEIAVFAAASETFSRKNTNASIAESLSRLTQVCQAARPAKMRIRGYVSCVLGCPYEGAVSLDAVAQVAEALTEMGCDEISLGDTIGVGTPLQARKLVESVSGRVPVHQLAVHFHDTYGQALANILATLSLGIAIIDSSVAGLGGCPYAPGASGNVATENVIYMLHGMGIQTGVDLNKLASAGATISQLLGRKALHPPAELSSPRKR